MKLLKFSSNIYNMRGFPLIFRENRETVIDIII